MVFASIIVGIAVSDQIISLNRLLRARTQVRWDWLPLAIAALVLLIAVQLWWNLSRGTGALTIGGFLPTLVELILLALLAFAVLPDEVPAEGLDLRVYYREQAGYIWTLFALAFAWTLATADVEAARAGRAWAAILGRQWEDLVFLALTASLIVVRRRWWHAVVVVALLSGPLGWLSRSAG